MHARTNIKSRSPSRHTAAGPHRAVGLFDVVEIFKKPPCIADLKPAGRDVAKDIPEIAGMPEVGDMLLLKGAIGKVAGVPSPELTWPVRFFDRKEGALESLSDQACPDDSIVAIDVIDTVNVKLSAAELAKRKTKWKPRETKHTTGALWKYAQRVGPAVDGATIHPGGAHEKQCYADI